MLIVAKNLRELDYGQLLSVYEEQLAKDGNQQAFYEDLSLFLTHRDNICCLWAPQGRYTACVRVEPHSDGALMTCMETAPGCRRQGFSFSLVQAVLRYLSQKDCQCVYVHVAKRNLPSIALHKKAGFRMISDSARLVDGTVSQNYVTMKIDLQ